MDIERYLLFVASSLAMAGSATAGVNAAIVKLNEGGPSYLYSARKLDPGDTIQFQFPKNDRPSCCGQSNWKAATLLAADQDAVDYMSGQELYRYRLKAAGISTAIPFIGMAVIGSKISVKQHGDWEIEARQGSVATDLRLCTSQEGVHVLRQSNGKQVHHLYLYLGYDIENPTCDSGLTK